MKNILKAAILVLASATALGAQAAGNIEAGKQLAQKSSCFACHGADYNTPIDPSYPKLAGQHKDYLEHAMLGYKRGVEGPNGRGNAIMSGQVQALSRKDIQDIAAYLHSLPGTMVVRK